MTASIGILVVGAGSSAGALAGRLRGLGCEVRGAVAPREAVERAAALAPGLVLTDLDGDPARAGVEAAERCGVPVVCLVGEAGAGSDGPPPTVPFSFVAKPATGWSLRLGIDAALSAQGRERAIRDEERGAAADVRRRVEELEGDVSIWRTVFDAINQPVLAVDTAGRILRVNAAARAVVGDTPARHDTVFGGYGTFRADGSTPFPHEDLPLARAMRGESPTDVEVRVRPPGQPAANVFVNVSGRPLRDAAGGLIGGVVVINNVTRIKETEQRLRGAIDELKKTASDLHEQVQMMDMIFENMTDGVVVADAQGRFTLFNKTAERLAGMGRTDSGMDRWSEHYGLFHADQVTPFAEEELPLVRAIGGESSNNVEMFVRNHQVPDGTFVAVDGRPLRNEAGEVSGGLAVVRDLSQSVAAKEAFISGRLEVLDTVLHNIGNAVNSVEVGTGTLHDGLRRNTLLRRLRALADAVAPHRDDPIPWLRDDPKGRKAVPLLVALAGDLAAQNDRWLATAERVRGRVRRIVEIVRYQSSRPAGRQEQKVVDLRRQIDEAVAVLRGPLAERGVRVEIDSGRAPEQIRIHESRFRQMLVGLVRNAMEAVEERSAAGGFAPGEAPAVRVAAYLDADHLVIDVIDNGVGIDPGRLRSIFAAGYTTKKDGNGLGLHSAANFVIGMGGRISPFSDGVGRGTTMRVMLRRSTNLPESLETASPGGK